MVLTISHSSTAQFLPSQFEFLCRTYTDFSPYADSLPFGHELASSLMQTSCQTNTDPCRRDVAFLLRAGGFPLHMDGINLPEMISETTTSELVADDGLLESPYSTVNKNPFAKLCALSDWQSSSYSLYCALPTVAYVVTGYATAMLICAVCTLFFYLRHLASLWVLVLCSENHLSLSSPPAAYCCVTPFFTLSYPAFVVSCLGQLTVLWPSCPHPKHRVLSVAPRFFRPREPRLSSPLISRPPMLTFSLSSSSMAR